MPTKRILGLDIGERRIGVALSDPLGILASPLTVLHVRGKEEAIKEVLKLAQEHEIGGIVVGLPLSLEGGSGPQATQIQEFVHALSLGTSIPVETWDERYSTVAAERGLREAGVGPARRKAKLDALAAALILQAYLDRRRFSSL